MQLFVTVNSPHTWVLYEPESQKLIDSGYVEDFENFQNLQSLDEIMMVVNGNEISSHQIKVPANNYKEAIAACPFVLEEEVTDDIDELQFSLLDWKASDEIDDILVVKHELIEKWLDQFEEKSIVVQDIVPDYLLLPTHFNASTIIAKIDEGQYLLKQGDNYGCYLDQMMLDLWVQANSKEQVLAVNDKDTVEYLYEQGFDNVIHWNFGAEISDWINHGGASKLYFPCLLQGRYDHSQEIKDIMAKKRAMRITMSGAVIVFLGLLINQVYFSFKDISLNKQTLLIYEKIFPDSDAGKVDNPILETRRTVSSLRHGSYRSGNFLPMFQLLARELANNNSLELINIKFENDILKAQINALDFATLDDFNLQLRETMQDYINVELAGSVALENIVEGHIEITLAGQQ